MKTRYHVVTVRSSLSSVRRTVASTGASFLLRRTVDSCGRLKHTTHSDVALAYVTGTINVRSVSQLPVIPTAVRGDPNPPGNMFLGKLVVANQEMPNLYSLLPAGLLSSSEGISTDFYPKPVESSPHTLPCFFKVLLLFYWHLLPRVLTGLLLICERRMSATFLTLFVPNLSTAMILFRYKLQVTLLWTRIPNFVYYSTQFCLLQYPILCGLLQYPILCGLLQYPLCVDYYDIEFCALQYPILCTKIPNFV